VECVVVPPRDRNRARTQSRKSHRSNLIRGYTPGIAPPVFTEFCSVFCIVPRRKGISQRLLARGAATTARFSAPIFFERIASARSTLIFRKTPLGMTSRPLWRCPFLAFSSRMRPVDNFLVLPGHQVRTRKMVRTEILRRHRPPPRPEFFLRYLPVWPNETQGQVFRVSPRLAFFCRRACPPHRQVLASEIAQIIIRMDLSNGLSRASAPSHNCRGHQPCNGLPSVAHQGREQGIVVYTHT